MFEAGEMAQQEYLILFQGTLLGSQHPHGLHKIEDCIQERAPSSHL